MNSQNMTLVMIPKEEWTALIACQQDILLQLKELKATESAIQPKYVTVKMFCETVDIGRTKLYELIKANKIKTIKKKRRVYIPISEINRFYSDSSIE